MARKYRTRSAHLRKQIVKSAARQSTDVETVLLYTAVALVVLAALVTLVMNTVLFVVPALEACSPTFFEYTIDAACVVHAIFLICIFLYDIVEPAVHSAMRSLRMPSPRRRRSNHRSRGCSCASSSVSAAPTAPLSLLQQLSPDEVNEIFAAAAAAAAASQERSTYTVTGEVIVGTSDGVLSSKGVQQFEMESFGSWAAQSFILSERSDDIEASSSASADALSSPKSWSAALSHFFHNGAVPIAGSHEDGAVAVHVVRRQQAGGDNQSGALAPAEAPPAPQPSESADSTDAPATAADRSAQAPAEPSNPPPADPSSVLLPETRAPPPTAPSNPLPSGAAIPSPDALPPLLPCTQRIIHLEHIKLFIDVATMRRVSNLGEGGFGQVVEIIAMAALNPMETDRKKWFKVRFALKIINNREIKDRLDYEREVANHERVYRRSGVMRIYGALPALPQITGCPPTDGFAGIFLPLASHGSLEDRLLEFFKRHPHKSGLPVEMVRYILAKIILSLSGVHQAGLLHLDIKTANLLLDWDLGLLLSDLGLMRPMDADGTCDVKCGTPGFQAPEVVAGKKYGPAADWYAVAVTLLRLASIETWAAYASAWKDNNPQAAIYTAQISLARAKLAGEAAVKRKRTHVKGFNCKNVKLTGHLADLLGAMLRVNPADRPTVAQMRDHDLFEGFDWAALEDGTMPDPLLGLP